MRPALTLLLLTFAWLCYGQNETNHWYFGEEAGMNFVRGKRQILTDGKMTAPAGCTSISDANGNLLFYSDGNTIYTSDHQVMTNGDNLQGNVNHFQNSIIIPKPKTPGVYYLFYSKNFNPPPNSGLFYAEIKFDAANPKGVVTSRSSLLRSLSSHRISAVHHTDGSSIWLATLHQNPYEKNAVNRFSVFKIDDTGIIQPPVVHTGKTTVSNTGVMKFSPDGTKLAVADYGQSDIFLYDFDASTGKLAHKTTIFTDMMIFTPTNPLGLAFSPDSKKIYFSAREVITRSAITQYYIDKPPTTPPTLDEKKRIYTSTDVHFGSLQLAVDGNIYVSIFENNRPIDLEDGIVSQSELGVLKFPDDEDTPVQYEHLSVSLGGKKASKGLPNFIQSYFRNRIIANDECVFENIDFKVDGYTTINAVAWDFGDGTTASGLQTNHTYTSPGNYTVSAEITFNGSTTTVYKDLNVFALPNLVPNQRLVQCDPDNNGTDYFNLTQITSKITSDPSLQFTYYESLADAQSASNALSNPQAYQNKQNPQTLYIRAVNENDCVQVAAFEIESVFVSVPSLTPLIVCEDSDGVVANSQGTFDLATYATAIRNQLSLAPAAVLNFYRSQTDAQTLNNPIPASFTSPSTTVWLRIDLPTGCGGIQSSQLIVNATPVINLQTEYTLCIDPSKHPPVILQGDPSNDRFEWRDALGQVVSTQANFQLQRIGKYNLTVYKTENGILCSNNRDFLVVNPSIPSIQSWEATATGDATFDVLIEVSGNGNYEYSLDDLSYVGSGNSHNFQGVPPGIQTVYIRDISRCEPAILQEITLLGFPSFFTPNNDGKNDVWRIAGAQPSFFQDIDIKIFNRYGRLLHRMNTYTADFGWEGIFNGKVLPPDGYWYSAKLTDFKGKVIQKTGNISLVRN